MNSDELMAYLSDLDDQSDDEVLEDGGLIHKDDDGMSDAPSIHSDHNTDSNISESEDDDISSDVGTDSANYSYGKNKFKWTKNPP
ncbi:hypothetical protein QE152_g26672 [Popillia japonica]|uniref:Uncharacterized protein n=1 Tax=Popillia japonica TaxID=7064 RepID=A0AAW1JYN5_POPJA